MRKLLLVSGALLVVAGIVSNNLLRHLRAERQVNAELRTQFATAKAAAGAPEPTVRPIVPSVSAAAPVAAAAVACAPPAEESFNVQAGLAMVTGGRSLTGSGEPELLKNPEYRKAQLTMARLKLAQSNPGLAAALGLSEAEANHLFEVMAEQQLKETAELTAAAALGTGASQAAYADALRRAGSAEESIRATLGEAKYAQFQDYQRNALPTLTQLASLGSSLTAAGQPLNDSQSRAMATTLLAEQQSLQQAPAALQPNGTARRATEILEEGYNRQVEGNKRILEAAASSLTPAQLATLRELFEKQAASRRRIADSAGRDVESRGQ